jgi:hypothetical protein
MFVVAAVLCVRPAFAQGPPPPPPPPPQTSTAPAPPVQTGTLVVTVVDPSGGVLPSALVSVVALDEAAKGRTFAPARATNQGVATLDVLPVGRYQVDGEFPGPGFEKATVKEVRVRPGDNKLAVTLPIKKVEDTVTVSQDPQARAADRASQFGTALTREQIQALSDDPDEMRRQLLEMAGPDAIIRVDSFEGGQLPSKAQIKSIHITRDQFAAESHYAGGTFVEIVTQPGIGPLRTSAGLRFRDSALDGRNPFTPTKPRTQTKGYNTSIGGTLIKDKADFSIFVSGTDAFSAPTIRAALPGGIVSDVANLRSPSTSVFGSGYLNWALTADQTLRLSIGVDRSKRSNLGVGNYSLAERAYANESNGYNVMIQEAGPVGRRFFLNTRAYVSSSTSTSESVLEAPTVIVNDAFTRGGAQQKGSRRTTSVTFASDLDYVRGRHSWRAGIALDGYRYRADEASNYLGTYTFASMADFEAGRPRSFTRRVGDPLIQYASVQAGVYLQDDIRVQKSLTLSLGVRYEAQNHLNDYDNIGPRLGITWSPFKSGRTSLRASYGIFYDWIGTGTFEQILRFDGRHQQEINVLDPSFPDDGSSGSAPPTNRYLYSDNVVFPRTNRFSLGISQSIPKYRVGFGATYSESRGAHAARGHNLNAPVLGVRPDPLFGNIVEVISDGRAFQRSLSTNFNFSLAAPSPAASAARINWRRISVFGSYTIGKSENDTDGAFAIPVSNGIASEWGPSGGDVRHRVNMSINAGIVRNLNASISMNAASAPPYTIRTGFDDNGDLIFNDRPEGVGRNTARAAGNWTMNANFGYSFAFGKRTTPLPPGIMITMVNGVPSVGAAGAPPSVPRYRLGLSVSISNLTNHHNLSGFSGVMTSPFFGKATTAIGQRSVNMSVNFSF